MSLAKKIKRFIYSYKVKDDFLKIRFLGFSKKIKLKKILSDRIALSSQVYDKIWLPYYNLVVPVQSQKPQIYNQDGKPMDTYFLRDLHSAHGPYAAEMTSKYFIFDRFDIGLDTHFYSHNAMLETMGKPSKKYGLLVESPSIVPNDYLIFEKNPSLSQDFDMIFTYESKILDKVENAKFFPFFAAPWYGTPEHGGEMSETAYQNKSKNISIVSANKRMCDLHNVRIAIAEKCKRMGLADTYGTFDGGNFVKNGVSLEQYRYSIVVENDLSPLFFTQKITSCFASQTVPIYIGTPQIGKFFNVDGIIQIKPDDVDNLEKILAACNEKDYLSRLPAILDNYQRVQKYLRMFDWLYENYLTRSSDK